MHAGKESEAASEHSRRAQPAASPCEVSRRPQLLRNLSISSLPSGSSFTTTTNLNTATVLLSDSKVDNRVQR